MITTVQPAIGYVYRSRCTGESVRVVTYDTDRNLVSVTRPIGHPWNMTIDGFWSNFIHADLYDASRN